MKKKLIPFIAALATTLSLGILAGCEDGKSAYEIWLDAGNTGTEQDFLDSLKGDKGDKGDQGEKGDKGDQGEKGETGETGAAGEKGDKGDQGETGATGDKGDKGDTGATGAPGKDGASVTAAKVVNGELILTIGGKDVNVGNVKGDKGDQGETGAAGAQGGTLKEGCKHTFVEYVAQHATCVNEAVTVNTCTTCYGYEVKVGEVDDSLHGAYSWEMTKKVVDVWNSEKEVWESKTVTAQELVFTEDIFYHPQTELEEASGACPEKTCNLCHEDLEQHRIVADKWVSVETGANECEDTYLAVQTCEDCHAVVTQIKEQPAKGHAWAYKSDDWTAAKAGKPINVTLECEACHKTMTVTANINAEKSVPVTCKEGGYDIYTYSYTYLKEPKTADVPGKKNVSTASAEHTFKTGTYVLKAELNGHVEYDKANGPALKALFDAKVLETVAGAAQLCTEKVVAVGRCDVCKTQITIEVTGEHTYGTYVPATCIEDGYLPCTVCATSPNPHRYVDVTKDLAKGHIYSYVADSFDETALTAKVRCACGDERVVSVVAGKVVNPTDCKSYPYTPYTTTGLTNGLATSHKNYNGDVKVTFNIYDKSAPLQHVIGANGDKNQIKNIVLDNNYDWNDKFAAQVKAGVIETIAGAQTACSKYENAIFRCSCCNYLITFGLSGEHDTTGKLETKNATCTNYGYTYKVCYDCNPAGYEVVYDYIEPTGHKFVVNEASKDAFLAKVKAGTVTKADTVLFECTCGEKINIGYDNIGKVIPGDSKCNPVDTTPYNFVYTYKIYTSAKPTTGVDKKFEDTINYTEGEMSHKLVVGSKSIDDIVVNEKYSSNDIWEAALVTKAPGLDTPIVEWIAGIPGDCGTYKMAVFRCADCNTMITVMLSGNHVLDGKDIVVYPTCTTEGKTYQTCTAANCPNTNNLVEIVSKRVPKTDHNYVWTITGASITSAGVCTGVCSNVDKNTGVACNDTVTAVAVATNDNKQSCCEDGLLTYTYYFDADKDGVKDTNEKTVVATKSFVLEATGEGTHDYAPLIKAAYAKEDGTFYVFTWCNEGKQFIQTLKAKWTDKNGNGAYDEKDDIVWTDKNANGKYDKGEEITKL